MDPDRVLNEWDDEMVQDALQVMRAEHRYQLRHKNDRPER